MSLPKRSLIKPLAIAVVLMIAVSIIVVYVIPRYVYVSPFSSFFASGIVSHKKIGSGTDNGVQFTTYTVSVRLFDDDPVNGIPSGTTLAYLVSEADWGMIAWGDTVKIKLFPNAKAEIVELYPTLSSPEWQQQQLFLRVNLTSNKQIYTLGENATFRVGIANAPLNEGDSPYNVSISVFQNCLFYVFKNGKVVSVNQNPVEIKIISLQPSQEVEYSFNWSIANVQAGSYYVRAYVGYLTYNEEAPLIGTTMVQVLNK